LKLASRIRLTGALTKEKFLFHFWLHVMHLHKT
jgi:hypothetical protein